MTVPCLLAAWSAHETELRRYLRHRLADPDEGDDLLHDLFLKACRQGEAFCAVEQPRAWLFEVARNTFLDHLRRQRPMLPLPPDLTRAEAAEAPVDALARCLPRVLSELLPPHWLLASLNIEKIKMLIKPPMKSRLIMKMMTLIL